MGEKSRAEQLENNPELFFERFKSRDDTALIFLKGGELGGLNLKVKSKIFDQLGKWFEVTEGDVYQPNFEEIAVRWGGAGLQYQFKKMENNPKFEKGFIEEGKTYLNRRDQQVFNEWLNKARTLSLDDPGLLRQELMLDYFSKEGQTLLLKLKEGLNRKTILNDLGLTNHNALVKAFGEKRADLNWADKQNVNFQDFVKRIVIGDTAAYHAWPGTVRSIIAKELMNGSLRKVITKAMEMKEKNPKIWQVEEGDYNAKTDDEETVISTLFNAVHSVDLSIDEFKLMTSKEIERFNKALEKSEV